MTLAAAVGELAARERKAWLDAAKALRDGDAERAELLTARAKALREAVAILMEVQR